MLSALVYVEVRSPNASQWRHYAVRARIRREEHAVVEKSLAPHPKPALPVVVRMTRLARRRVDDDNLQGAFKAIRDAIAKWLGCGDGPNDPIRWEYAQESAKLPGPIRRVGKRGSYTVQLKSYARVEIACASEVPS